LHRGSRLRGMQLALFVSVVVHLSHTKPQHVQGLATVTGSTVDIREVSVNAAGRSITLVAE